MISIIFITQNRKSELFRAIESCFKQDYQDFEVIIIDNASKINISSDIDTMMDKYEFHNYRYIYLEENLGVAGGRNYGFKIAKGEISFFLDDDAVIVSTNALSRALGEFAKDSEIVAIACNIYQPIDNSYLFSSFMKKKDAVLTYVGAAHFIRNSFWENRKLYPDNLLFGSEELYSSFAIYKQNKYIKYCDEIKVNHLPSTINRKSGKERIIDINTNIYIIKKYYYPKKTFRMLKFFFMVHMLKNGIFDFKEVKAIVNKRYNSKYEDRMNVDEYRRFRSLTTFKQRY